MKKILYILFILSIILPLFVFCSNSDDETKVPPPDPEVPGVEVPSAKQAVDIVLLYHGDVSRLEFNQEQVKHYLYRQKDGKVEWLYDGFLFVEFHMVINGVDFDFEVDNNHRTPAKKTEWEFLLSKTFEEGKGPDALEEVMEGLAKEGITPPYKRRVIISLPNPVVNRKNWGEINGKLMDFSKPEDRVTALSWYIDRVLEIWKEKDYKHLDLEGFYWTREEVHVKDGDDDLMRSIKKKIGKDYEFSWIPYYGSADAHDWKDYDFDIAYQQPNYFFELASPMEILTGAISYAGRHDLSLEMEFDSRLINQKGFRDKYYDYIEEFRKDGAWDNKRITYYEGGDGWYKMAISKNPDVIEAYNTLADIMVKRKETLPVIIKK